MPPPVVNVTAVKIANIEKSIGKIERSVEGMATTLSKVAVQQERLNTLTSRVDACWKKLDKDIVPIAQTCPRDQIKWLWCVLIPMGLTQIALGLVLLKIFFTGGLQIS